MTTTHRVIRVSWLACVVVCLGVFQSVVSGFGACEQIIVGSAFRRIRQGPAEAGPHVKRYSFQAAAQGLTALQPTDETPAGLMAEGRRLFDLFQYQAAIGVFDRAIGALVRAAPPDVALLAQAYELRGRAAFAIGNRANAERDFAALLAVRPEYTLAATVSPTIVTLFNAIKRQTVGQLLLATVPDADVSIDGRRYNIREGTPGIELTVGDHALTAARPGYRPIAQTLTIKAGETETLTLTLERITSTLRVLTAPAGVEVLLDGTTRGVTGPSQDRTDPAASLLIEDVVSGEHRLELRRACYTTVARGVPIDRPSDFRVGPFQLEPAVAKIKVETADRDVSLYLDGKLVGPAPTELNDLCEGPHVIEARSPRGRFLDRRTWKAGDVQTLRAVLRPALALVDVVGSKDERTAADLRITVEQTLAGATGVIVFAPTDAEVDSAYRNASAPKGSLAISTTPKETRRELGRKLAARLETQGVAWIEGTDRDSVVLSVLADGSGEPDRISLRLSDPRSRSALVDLFNSRPIALLRPSLDASVVEAAGENGVVIVRVPKAGAAVTAGLVAGDVIAKIANTPVATVRDLAAQLTSAPPNLSVTLTVRARDGREREVPITPTQAPAVIGLRERGVLWNKFLLDMREAARANSTFPRAQAAARMATALAHMRLGNWEAAREELDQVSFGDTTGAWVVTLSYLNGLSFEGLGRSTEARAAFERAAAAFDTALVDEGPSINVLARQKLR